MYRRPMGKLIRSFYPALWGVLLLLTGCEQVSPQQQWLQVVADRIAADYGDLQRQAGTLSVTLQNYCASPAPEPLAAARDQWRQTMDAWQRVQWVRFGPITENNDDWKIQFWPDQKNIVSRKAQRLLNTEGPIDAARVADASVVLQGLSALELLLFDPDYMANYGLESGEQTPQGRRQCELITAIGKHFAGTTTRVHQAWVDSGIRQQWQETSAAPDHSGKGPMAEVVGAMLSQLEIIKTDKLGAPLGYKSRSHTPNGYFSESWRSQSSLRNIWVSLQTLYSLAKHPEHYDLEQLLQQTGHGELAADLDMAFAVALQTLADIQQPLVTAVADSTGRQQVVVLHQAIAQLNSRFKQQLAPALGISLGFNANDGD
ncbi:MAG: hypothetical protein CML06_19505 [Pseudomonadales bacterium]|nr:hypothetical protein [Pseudomonadales bacterium]